MLNKPAWWLPTADWCQWLERHKGADGHVRCKYQGCTKDADTVDHIVPRTSEAWNGDMQRAHAPDNLQPMCRKHNSQKSTRPDDYWSKTLYFDRRINIDKLRASQADFIYSPLFSHRAHIAGRFSQINGKLHTFLQCTGAGKTIGKAMIPFALNHGALEQFADQGHKPPRCDRLLIVPITADLRDQIALELGGRTWAQCRGDEQPIQSQLVEFGIVDKAPRVKKIQGFDALVSASTDFNHDIYVACSQSLWDVDSSAGSPTIDDWVRAFQSFPVIIFDEFHRYSPRIREVVHRSVHSLCFGVSATPMTGLGGLFDDITRITEYEYRNAALKDNSMKSLGKVVDDERTDIVSPTFEDIITEMRSEEAQRLDGTTSSGLPLGNFVPMKTVGWACVERLRQTDNRRRDRALIAPFRHHLRSSGVKKVVADLDYAGHCVIGVSSIEEMLILQEHLNDEFERRRSEFPRDRGWHASVTHSGRAARSRAQAIAPVPLDEKHPWMRSLYLRKQGVIAPYIDEQCSRILIAVDKCKEGTNNVFCNVVGWARRYDTPPGLVQRNGRAVRSFHVLDADGTLHVPPQELDTVHIVTHEAYGNGAETFEERHAPLIRSLHFLVDPYGYRDADGRCLQDIPSFYSWLEGDVGVEDLLDGDEEQLVTLDDQGKIVDYLAEIERTGSVFDERELLKRCRIDEKLQAKQGRRRRAVIDRATEIRSREPERIQKLRVALGLTSSIQVGELRTIAVDEKPDLNLSPDRAIKYMLNMSKGEQLEEMAAALAITKGSDYAQDVLSEYCTSNAPVYRGRSYFEHEAPRLICSSIHEYVTETVNTLRRRFPTQLESRNDLYGYATVAIKMKLGLSRQETLAKGGSYDVPAVYTELAKDRHKREILGFVLQQVITPEIERVLALDEDNNDES